MSSGTHHLPEFFTELIQTSSASGYEAEAFAVFDKRVKPAADLYACDALGNRLGFLNPAGSPTVLLTGYLDEPGFIITHISKDGFVYFDLLGEHDRSAIAGRSVVVHSGNGPVKGITGKRIFQLGDGPEHKKTSEVQDMWIDIGTRSKRATLDRVAIGDAATYDRAFEVIHGSVGAGRGLEGKLGAYVAGEAFIRLARDRSQITCKLAIVAAVQGQIGTGGVGPAAFSVSPELAIAVDCRTATDVPESNKRKHGDIELGGGPILSRGPNISGDIFRRLQYTANGMGLPYQVEAEARPNRGGIGSIQLIRNGILTGRVRIPIRYSGSPSEVVDLRDVESCVQLLVEFAKSDFDKDT